MKSYKIKIGYAIEMNITAKNKKEAEEIAWFEFDQSICEPEIEIKEAIFSLY